MRAEEGEKVSRLVVKQSGQIVVKRGTRLLGQLAVQPPHGVDLRRPKDGRGGQIVVESAVVKQWYTAVKQAGQIWSKMVEGATAP